MRQPTGDTYIDHLSFADSRPIESLHQVPKRSPFALLYVFHVARKLFYLVRVCVEMLEKGQIGIKSYVVGCLILPISFWPFLGCLDELEGRWCRRLSHETRPVVKLGVCDQHRRCCRV